MSIYDQMANNDNDNFNYYKYINTNNSCYLNSSLQLLHDIDYINVDSQTQHDNKTNYARLLEQIWANLPERTPPLDLKKMPNIYSAAQTPIYEEFLTVAGKITDGSNVLRNGRQEDAGEFLTKFLEKAYADDSAIKKSLRVRQVTTYECEKPTADQYRDDNYDTILKLPIPLDFQQQQRVTTIAELVHLAQLKREVPDNNDERNRIATCDNPPTKVACLSMQSKFETSKNLLIQLVRNVFNKSTKHQEKNSTAIFPDMVLRIDNKDYDLKGCIQHHGDHFNNGHYAYLTNFLPMSQYPQYGVATKYISDNTFAEGYDPNSRMAQEGYIYFYEQRLPAKAKTPPAAPAKAKSKSPAAKAKSKSPAKAATAPKLSQHEAIIFIFSDKISPIKGFISTSDYTKVVYRKNSKEYITAVPNNYIEITDDIRNANNDQLQTLMDNKMRGATVKWTKFTPNNKDLVDRYYSSKSGNEVKNLPFEMTEFHKPTEKPTTPTPVMKERNALIIHEEGECDEGTFGKQLKEDGTTPIYEVEYGQFNTKDEFAYLSTYASISAQQLAELFQQGKSRRRSSYVIGNNLKGKELCTNYKKYLNDLKRKPKETKPTPLSPLPLSRKKSPPKLPEVLLLFSNGDNFFGHIVKGANEIIEYTNYYNELTTTKAKYVDITKKGVDGIENIFKDNGVNVIFTDKNFQNQQSVLDFQMYKRRSFTPRQQVKSESLPHTVPIQVTRLTPPRTAPAYTPRSVALPRSVASAYTPRTATSALPRSVAPFARSVAPAYTRSVAPALPRSLKPSRSVAPAIPRTAAPPALSKHKTVNKTNSRKFYSTGTIKLGKPKLKTTNFTIRRKRTNRYRSTNNRYNNRYRSTNNRYNNRYSNRYRTIGRRRLSYGRQQPFSRSSTGSRRSTFNRSHLPRRTYYNQADWF